MTWVLAAALSMLVAAPPQDDDDEELATVVVTATRHPRLIGQEPLRVEAVPAEEIAENSTVRPGDLTSLLQELPGVRFDSGSAGFGASGLHLRGFPARHALVLRDGLPLPTGDTAGFGLLQIPPLDLQRVEVIKGVSTPLYGSSALAGVLNLVSASGPGDSAVTFSTGSRGVTDMVAFLRPDDADSPDMSLLVADSRQTRQDIDGDHWYEIPGYTRRSLRPRWTMRDAAGRSLSVTASLMDEDRVGGTADASSALGRGFALRLRNKVRDIGFAAKLSADGDDGLEVRGSVHEGSRTQRVDARVDDTTQHESWLEATRTGSIGMHDWLVGASLQHQRFVFPARTDLAYARTRTGVFVSDSFALPQDWAWQIGARYESVGGEALRSARIAGLYKVGPSADIRLSLARGASPASYDLPELDDAGIGALARSTATRAEVATTASLDIDWRLEDLELVAGAFTGRVDHLLDLRRLPDGRLELHNSPTPLRVDGLETVARYVEGPWHIMASWTQLRTDAPLTPRYTGELAMLHEVAGRWRLGLEFAFTGPQRLDPPGTADAPATCEVSVLAARQWHGVTLFINGMNLNDSRQTRRTPLLGGSSALGALPVREAWGSLSGRTINIGVRVGI